MNQINVILCNIHYKYFVLSHAHMAFSQGFNEKETLQLLLKITCLIYCKCLDSWLHSFLNDQYNTLNESRIELVHKKWKCNMRIQSSINFKVFDTWLKKIYAGFSYSKKIIWFWCVKITRCKLIFKISLYLYVSKFWHLIISFQSYIFLIWEVVKRIF